jgi:hypothetical protein
MILAGGLMFFFFENKLCLGSMEAQGFLIFHIAQHKAATPTNMHICQIHSRIM